MIASRTEQQRFTPEPGRLARQSHVANSGRAPARYDYGTPRPPTLAEERRYPFAHSNALGGVVLALVLIAIDSLSLVGPVEEDPPAVTRAHVAGPMSDIASALQARLEPALAEPDGVTNERRKPSATVTAAARYASASR